MVILSRQCCCVPSSVNRVFRFFVTKCAAVLTNFFFFRMSSTFYDARGTVPPVPPPAQRLGLLKVVLSIAVGLTVGATIRNRGSHSVDRTYSSPPKNQIILKRIRGVVSRDFRGLQTIFLGRLEVFIISASCLFLIFVGVFIWSCLKQLHQRCFIST